MLTIFYEWKNSLTLFKKDTFLLILYSWYKLTVQVYIDLFFCFGVFLFFSMPFMTILFVGRGFGMDPSIFSAACNTLFVTMYYIVILLARPTLEKKDIRYVMSKGFSYLGSVVMTCVLYVWSQVLVTALILVIGGLFVRYNLDYFIDSFLFISSFFNRTSIEPFLSVWILLFLLDSKGSIRDCFKAVWHGYKMVLYNAPILIFLVTFLAVGYYAIALLDTYFSSPFQGLLYLAMFPIAITLITTVYIKRVHDQCNLYFGRRGT